MGRWSRLVAEGFLTHVPVPERGTWLDVGCGTGELLGAVLRFRHPLRAVGIDSSPDFVYAARRRWRDFTEVAVFEVGSAQQLPYPDATFDGVVSGLALNFVPEPQAALAEMARVARPGATVGLYVWDYEYPDFFLTRYWAAVQQVLGRRAAGDERHRWPLCSPQGLTRLLSSQAQLASDVVFPVTTTTVFADAAELWDSFSLGVGPAGAVMGKLDPGQRQAMRNALEDHLPVASDGSIHLSARAWSFAATALEGGGARTRVDAPPTVGPSHPARKP
jgi:SAM-dependent methyltransferase